MGLCENYLLHMINNLYFVETHYYNNNDFESAVLLFEKALKDSVNSKKELINLFLKYHYAVSLKNIHEFKKSKDRLHCRFGNI